MTHAQDNHQTTHRTWIETAARAAYATRRERLLAALASLVALWFAWVTFGLSLQLSESCAAQGVTCNSILTVIPWIAWSFAAITSLIAILPWGFRRLQPRRDAQ